MNTSRRTLEIALPKAETPLSIGGMSLGMSTTVFVMTLVGLWFIGEL